MAQCLLDGGPYKPNSEVPVPSTLKEDLGPGSRLGCLFHLPAITSGDKYVNNDYRDGHQYLYGTVWFVHEDGFDQQVDHQRRRAWFRRDGCLGMTFLVQRSARCHFKTFNVK